MKADDSDLWNRASRIVLRALTLPEAERLPYLKKQCAEEKELLDVCLAVIEMENEDDVDFTDHHIGNYTVGHLLGRGAFSKVHVAGRSDPPSVVAIKFIRPSSSGSAERTLRRFQREKRTLGLLVHDNIVPILDQGISEEGWPYFVMPYIEGSPLVEYALNGNITIEARLDLFLQLLDAVEYMHARYVHRDLKPANVLVTTQGRVKLLDFGVAKSVYIDSLEEHGDEDLGTIEPHTEPYASPEHFLRKPVNSASDIYSLGVMLFELLAGRLPFINDGHEQEFRQQVCTAERPRPSDVATEEAARNCGFSSVEPLRRRLRPDLDAIVLKAIHREASRRYKHASDLAADIRRYLRGRPVDAAEGGRAYRARKFVARHQAAMALGAILLISLVAAAMALWIQNTRLAALNRGLDGTVRALRNDNEQLLAHTRERARAVQQALDAATVQALIDRARLWENIARALHGNGDPESEALSIYAREAYLQAGELYKTAGEQDQADAVAAMISSIPKTRGGPAGFSADDPRIPLFLARTRLAIAQLQETAQDSEGARQSYEALLKGLEDQAEPSPEIRALLDEVRAKLNRPGDSPKGRIE